MKETDDLHEIIVEDERSKPTVENYVRSVVEDKVERTKMRVLLFRWGLHAPESIMENESRETRMWLYKLNKVVAIACMIVSFGVTVVALIDPDIVTALVLALIWFIEISFYISNERAKVKYGLDREENI